MLDCRPHAFHQTQLAIVATSSPSGRNAVKANTAASPRSYLVHRACWRVHSFQLFLFVCKPHKYSENNTKKPACGEAKGKMRCLPTHHVPSKHGIWFLQRWGKSCHVSYLKRVSSQRNRPLASRAWQARSIATVKYQDPRTSEKLVSPQQLKVLWYTSRIQKWFTGAMNSSAIYPLMFGSQFPLESYVLWKLW